MFKSMEGKSVPAASFRTREAHEWVEKSSSDIFDGKTVVVFSLPGAFTPTCSSSHVPRFDQLAPAFKKLGVDEIICVSVNDAFVMNEWKAEQKASRVTFLPDGNGEFTDKMGMLVGKEDLGFGKRSWRYSMLVRNGVVEKMFVEEEIPGDPYSVSDADTMLEYLAPGQPKPLDVAVFSRKDCGFCAKAKALLDEAGIEFEELVLNQDYTDRTLRAVTAASSFPQIFIGGEHIGGADDLETYLDQRRAA